MFSHFGHYPTDLEERLLADSATGYVPYGLTPLVYNRIKLSHCLLLLLSVGARHEGSNVRLNRTARLFPPKRKCAKRTVPQQTCEYLSTTHHPRQIREATTQIARAGRAVPPRMRFLFVWTLTLTWETRHAGTPTPNASADEKHASAAAAMQRRLEIMVTTYSRYPWVHYIRVCFI